MRTHYLSLCLFLLSFSLYVEAQSPGGVNGAELWYMSVPTGRDLTGTYEWKDFSGDTVKSRIYEIRLNNYTAAFQQRQRHIRTFNFNPALNLSENGKPKVSLLRYTSLAQSTIIGLFCPKPSDKSKDAVLYAISGRLGSGSLLSKDKALSPIGLPALDYGKEKGQDLLYSSADAISQQTFDESSLRIVSYIKSGMPSHSVWGEELGSIYSVGSTYDKKNLNFKNAFDATLFGNNAFDGYSPEVIVFARQLSNTERLQVESYLALKYGVTLKGSYLSPRGDLIWDASSNATYHHRVTGLAREDGELLSQLLSTTSYEETPRYSSINDSYYQSNPYNLSSESRLLVIGREKGSPLPDGSCLIWGDDGGNTATLTPNDQSPWHIMGRKWLVKTNLHSTADTTSVWKGDGFSVKNEGYIATLLQEEGKDDAVVLSKPLVGRDGSISFICPSASLDIGFTAAADGNELYGYRISGGKIFQLIKGTPQRESLSNVSAGERITISKSGDVLNLLIGAEGSSRYSVYIPSTEECRIATIRSVSGSRRLELTEVRASGFGDTGNVVELGTSLSKDKNFTRFASNALLLIDETGTGDIDPETVRIYRCSETDAKRGKAIFHNVFLDTDGSGSDVFTFAYYDGLLARLTPSDASCTGGKPNADGSVSVNVIVGTPSYSYRVHADSVAGFVKGTLLKTGNIAMDKYTISGLLPGSYHIQVIQTGGTNLTANISDRVSNAYANSSRKFSKSEFSWSVCDLTSSYQAGLSSVIRTSGMPDYGFEVRGATATIIVGRQADVSKQFTISQGDILSLAFNGQHLDYKINGKVVAVYDKLRIPGWFFTAIFTQRPSHIGNLLVENQACPILAKSPDLTVETISRSVYEKIVTVGSECAPMATKRLSERSLSDDQIGVSDDSSFNVTETVAGSFTAHLSMARDISADLLVFDTSGKMLYNAQMEGGLEKTATFTLPQTGVYIVKAITQDKEYTQKILSR